MIGNNILDNIFVGQLANTLAGPVVTSQVFDPQTLTYMTMFEWEVFNGALLVEPLPFGLFAEIKPLNINKAKLVLRVTPGYPIEPIFQEVCAEDRSVNPQLVSAIVCRKVVPLGSPADVGTGIWESVLEAIDATHAMKVTKRDPVIFNQRSFTVTREDTVPPRFRPLRGTQEITQTVPGLANLPAIQPGDELRSEQQQTVHTKQVTTRTRDNTKNTVLNSSAAYAEGVKATITETLASFKPEAEQGLLIISSEVTDLGDGQWVKETHTSPSWPILKGTKVIEELNGIATYTEQFVAPTQGGEPNVEYTPVNIDRTLKRTYNVPTAALDSYHDSYPVRINLTLPQVLKSIKVIWNTSSESGQQSSDWTGASTGQSYSLTGNLTSGSGSSVAVIPEILVELEETWGNNLPATGHIVYMKMPLTEAAILARFSAQRWPVFKPQSHTIVGCGQKIGCSVKVSVGASSSGSPTNVSKDAGKTASSDKDVSLTNNVVRIPMAIHDAIMFGGELTKNLSATAEGSTGLSGFNFPTIKASLTENIKAVGLIEPKSFPATRGPTAIPTSGTYLIDSQVQPYKWGYAKVYAEIFNASVLA